MLLSSISRNCYGLSFTLRAVKFVWVHPQYIVCSLFVSLLSVSGRKNKYGAHNLITSFTTVNKNATGLVNDLMIRITLMRIRILLSTWIRIQILPFTLMRIRVLPFSLMRIRIISLTFPRFGHSIAPKRPPRLPPYHFDADPDPAFHFDADPNPAFHFNTDRDPDFHFDADSVPDPASQNSGARSATLVPNFKRLNPVLYKWLSRQYQRLHQWSSSIINSPSGPVISEFPIRILGYFLNFLNQNKILCCWFLCYIGLSLSSVFTNVHRSEVWKNW